MNTKLAVAGLGFTEIALYFASLPAHAPHGQVSKLSVAQHALVFAHAGNDRSRFTKRPYLIGSLVNRAPLCGSRPSGFDPWRIAR